MDSDKTMKNPLLQKWNTPFDTPPFELFKVEHFRPAVEAAIAEAAEEINSITSDPQPSDFKNTIEALEKAGDRIDIISAILFNLNSAETNKDLQAATQEITPVLTRFANDITLNDKLFAKVKHVYDSRESSGLNTEQMMLLEKVHRNFVLGGAGLDDDKKVRFRSISEELSLLSVRFEENILEETNSYLLHLTDQDDLTGLPESVIEMAGMEAKNRNLEGWVFTLHFPSYMPFMKYSEKKDLREKMYRAYTSRAFHENKTDNRSIVLHMVNLRLELAKILGFNTYAEFALQDRMADSTEKAVSFLEELHSASFPAAKRDFENICKFAASAGFSDKIERWDWAYYSEKLQKAKFDIDDEILKPYFTLENVERAIFKLANDLYGIKFKFTAEIPVYNREVKTWEVHDENDSFLAILYIDYFPRPGKNGGAWMTCYRDQQIFSGKDIRPLISLVANFTRPTDTKPSLLTFNEVLTFLHEFGHALHGILTRCTYESLSGTNVARDFVELPSQFMENFAYEKEWLSTWATHFKTKERIPDGIIQKIKGLSTFNEGYACNRQLSFAFLDMAWHTLNKPVNKDIVEFESEAIEKTELFPPVKGSNTSVSFGHIFGGGYAAGYYGYKWAEVLDADAFKHFRETGIFNSETALSFRKNILEKGGTDKPMKLYVKFRGKEPTIDAFLERSGLK
jgi:peptidyl-dipeptidase Dcp